MTDERTLLRVGEAAQRLAISRSKTYALIQAGRLPGAMKVGASIRVSAKALDEWIARQAARSDA